MIECLIVPQRPNLEPFGQTAAVSFRGGERDGVKQVIRELLGAGQRTCAAFLLSLIVSVCFDDQLLFTDETQLRSEERNKISILLPEPSLLLLLLLVNMVMHCCFLITFMAFLLNSESNS